MQSERIPLSLLQVESNFRKFPIKNPESPDLQGILIFTIIIAYFLNETFA